MIRLIISPHADDAEYGCFSVIENSTVAVISINEEKLKYQDRPPYKVREKEAFEVSKYCKSNLHILSHIPVCYYTIKECIELIENEINKIKPEEIYIPTGTSYNQDHKVIYDASFIALRPHDKNYFVNKVFVYEQEHTFLWSGGGFISRYFKRVDINAKEKAYNLYKTQIRSFRSFEYMKVLARLRGEQSRYDFAESFDILRYIDN